MPLHTIHACNTQWPAQSCCHTATCSPASLGGRGGSPGTAPPCRHARSCGPPRLAPHPRCSLGTAGGQAGGGGYWQQMGGQVGRRASARWGSCSFQLGKALQRWRTASGDPTAVPGPYTSSPCNLSVTARHTASPEALEAEVKVLAHRALDAQRGGQVLVAVVAVVEAFVAAAARWTRKEEIEGRVQVSSVEDRSLGQ